MEYFELEMPVGDGRCSDDDCPCGFPGETIPRGTGYLYISKDVVDFRRDARSIREAENKIELIKQRSEANIFFATGTVAPILLCEQGAKKRGIDLKISSSDAKYAWENNKAPLRHTPLEKASPQKEARKEQCKQCGKIVLASEYVCPYCGRTQWGYISRFYVFAILLVLIGVFVCDTGGWRWFWVFMGVLLSLGPISETVKSIAWRKK